MNAHNNLAVTSDCCPFTDTDLTTDIERLISKTVLPYVDPSNPMLHFDELQAEYRASRRGAVTIPRMTTGSSSESS